MSNVKKMLLTTLLSMPAMSLFSSLETTPNSLPPASSDQALEAQNPGMSAINANKETTAEDLHVNDLMNLPTEPSKSTTAEQRQKMHDDKVQHVNDIMNLPTEPIKEQALAKTEHSDQSSTAHQEPAVFDHALDRRASVQESAKQLEVVHTAASELGSKIASSDSVILQEHKEMRTIIEQKTKEIENLKKSLDWIINMFYNFSFAVGETAKEFNSFRNNL